MAELLGEGGGPEKQLEEMRRKMREEAKEAIRCQWTHTDEASGKKYLCSNERFVHPWRRVIDRFGVSVLEEFTCCAWHMSYARATTAFDRDLSPCPTTVRCAPLVM